jgi:hypothetical protein
MINLLYIFLGIVLLRFIVNLSKLVRSRIFLNQYLNWLNEQNFKMFEHKSQVIKLLKGAGVQDSVRPVIQPAGDGGVAKGEVSVFDNFPDGREDFVAIMRRKFL